IFDLLLDVPDAPENLSPVGLELSFARSASADAAAELRHFHAAPRQPWQHVFELRQFHLQLTFTSAGVTGKNIENQLRAIDDARVDDALNVALLRRRKIVIEQDHIRGNRGCRARDLLQLALADQRGRVRPVFALREFAGNLRPRACSQRPQFVERIFGTEIGAGIPGISRQERRRRRCSHTRSVISSRLRSRSNARGTRLSPARAAFRPKLHPHQERAFPLLGWIQHRLGRTPRTISRTTSRTIAAAQSGVISAQANSLYPSVPEAEVALAASPTDAAAGLGSVCLWAPREMTTLEIACLKMT